AEEIVVTARRQAQPAHEVGSAISVFTRDDIITRGARFVPELLREVPGTAVNRTAGIGGLTQVRLRGSEANHALVLIDGIEVNDPAFGSEFNFAPLATGAADRIEVLRGPQSALYGSDAIGGVIAVCSPRPAPGEHLLHLDAAAGTRGTAALQASGGVATSRLAAWVSLDRYRTAGISASPLGGEKDGFNTTTTHASAWWQPVDTVSAHVVLRQTEGRSEEDSQDFDFPVTSLQGLVVDSANVTDARHRYALGEVKGDFLDGAWQPRLAWSLTDTANRFLDAGLQTAASGGERNRLEADNTFHLDTPALRHDLTVGVQREWLAFHNRSTDLPDANQDRKDRQSSLIAEYGLAILDTVWTSVAYRRDNNHRFDDATTVRATAAWRVTSNVRVHASYGEGVVNPGFFELYGFLPDSFSGNPELKPERSNGADVGVELSLLENRLRLDTTVFRARLHDEIVTRFDLASFTFTPENLNGSSAREGVELSLTASISANTTLTGSYTRLDARDQEGLRETRRPGNTASLDLNRRIGQGRGNLNLGIVHNGRQKDLEFIFATPEDRVALDGYTLVNIAVSYNFTPVLSGYLRAENLLDTRYHELFGYRSPGRSLTIGVRYQPAGRE
ncbi:MAG: TonB-dependent receptor, partial [Pseudomonadales bacterium]